MGDLIRCRLCEYLWEDLMRCRLRRYMRGISEM